MFGTSSAQSGAPVPASAQALRNDVARVEASLYARAEQMTRASTECESCAEALGETAAAAQQRLAEAGGPWERWEDQAGESTDAVPSPPDAPFTVGPLTGLMLASAGAQLKAAAASNELSSPERLALASILAGRAGSALVLANFYGIDVDKAIENLPEPLTASLVAGEAASAEEPASLPLEDAGPAADPLALTPAQRALTEFDCARTLLLRAALPEVEAEEVASAARNLNDRINLLVELGVENHAGLRCSAPSVGLAAATTAAMQGDFALLETDDLGLRQLAANYLLVDARLWATWDPATVPTTSLLPIAEVEVEPDSR